MCCTFCLVGRGGIFASVIRQFRVGSLSVIRPYARRDSRFGHEC
jgi:hypothetical protein